ncbi:hypothetical protein Pcinc_013195 [Petrolisthes cinctipes]|uniref:Uncharacterized protein n=1 Tax=Petrolisthes cinctipes TaxID=88211 RepID=A0AAE1FZL9_PETCI|nr:hypothetical protein Pcinc_013195 [Petrolisthes cinctipes]
MAETIDSARWLIRDVLKGLREVEEALAIIGLIYVGKKVMQVTLELLGGLRTHVLPRLMPKRYEPPSGSWAVVTGGDQWTRQGYTKALIEKGVNVLLLSNYFIAEDAVAYQTCKTKESPELQICAGARGEVRVLQMDRIEWRVNDILTYLEEMDITTLVWCPEEVRYPYDNTWEWSESIELLTVLVKQFVRKTGMRQQSGAIVLVSTQPHVQSYIKSNARSLGEYLSKRNIHNIKIQTVIPFYPSHHVTNIPFLQYFFHYILGPYDETFASSALATIGHTSTTSGHWFHAIMNWLVQQGPTYMPLGFYAFFCYYNVEGRFRSGQ